MINGDMIARIEQKSSVSKTSRVPEERVRTTGATLHPGARSGTAPGGVAPVHACVSVTTPLTGTESDKLRDYTLRSIHGHVHYARLANPILLQPPTPLRPRSARPKHTTVHKADAHKASRSSGISVYRWLIVQKANRCTQHRLCDVALAPAASVTSGGVQSAAPTPPAGIGADAGELHLSAIAFTHCRQAIPQKLRNGFRMRDGAGNMKGLSGNFEYDHEQTLMACTRSDRHVTAKVQWPQCGCCHSTNRQSTVSMHLRQPIS